HEGVDIAAALGSPVTAARTGSVARVLRDDLYGTVVVMDHGDGVQTVYANLQDVPAVSVGDWVELGAPIGAVGDTALCEIGQDTHLHFAVTVNGKTVDPLQYLPA
ncbi:MAG: M23 family metallopeptidase, partial [Oscillospiraceae bacterium]|nr:M23 family metallopeptidase [Oscillospiraceae bacterium]